MFFTQAALDKRRATAAAKLEAKQTAEAAKRAETAATWAALVDADEGIRLIIAQARPEGSDFLADLVRQGAARGGMTPNQYAAGLRVAQERAAEGRRKALDAATSKPRSCA